MPQINTSQNLGELFHNEIAQGLNFTQTTSAREDPRVVEANIRIKEADAAHQRLKNLLVVCFALGLITVLVGVFCLCILTGSPYAERAMTMLLTLTGGLVGFLIKPGKQQ